MPSAAREQRCSSCHDGCDTILEKQCATYDESLDSLENLSASARFTTLMRELAAEHASQVAKLRKELAEARAAVVPQRPAGDAEAGIGTEPAIALPVGDMSGASNGQHLTGKSCPVERPLLIDLDKKFSWQPEDEGKVDPLQCHFPGEQDGRTPRLYRDAASDDCPQMVPSGDGCVPSRAKDVTAESQANQDVVQHGDAGKEYHQDCQESIEAAREVDGTELPLVVPEEKLQEKHFHHHGEFTASAQILHVRSMTEEAFKSLSVKFDMVIGACIVGNALVMALQIEYNGRKFDLSEFQDCVGQCGRLQIAEDFFEIMEHIFCGIFALELLVRLKCEGCKYLRDVSNLLDAMIVIVSVIDSWVLGPLGEDSMGNVAILRLMRLLRLAKVLRVVRVMKAFSSLRVLVGAVANSVGALGWSMTLLFVLELIGAIFMAQVAIPFIEDESTDLELRQFMFTHFGTWTSAMLTIFEVTMAPGGFVRYRRLYEEVHAVFGVFFVVYVCVVTFAVVRVITALFLKATLAASASDEMILAQEHVRTHVEYVASLKLLCLNGCDDFRQGEPVDRACVVTRDVLQSLLQEPHFKDWLKHVSLDAATIRRIYNILEQGSDGKVDFDEWADAVVQLARPSQHVETIVSLLETRTIFRRIIEVEQLLCDNFCRKGARQRKSTCRTSPVSACASEVSAPP